MSFTVNLGLIAGQYNNNNAPFCNPDNGQLLATHLKNVEIIFDEPGISPRVNNSSVYGMRIQATWEGRTPIITIYLPEKLEINQEQISVETFKNNNTPYLSAAENPFNEKEFFSKEIEFKKHENIFRANFDPRENGGKINLNLLFPILNNQDQRIALDANNLRDKPRKTQVACDNVLFQTRPLASIRDATASEVAA